MESAQSSCSILDFVAPRAAKKGGARAIVGGLDFAVGGWGAAEIERRAVGGGRPADRYPGRTALSAGDAARSVLADARRGLDSPSALRRAAAALAAALRRLEDRLCDPDETGVWECRGDDAVLTVPPVTSEDLQAFADDPAAGADVDAMYDLYHAVEATAAALRLELPLGLPAFAPRGALPALSTRVVPVSDTEGVLSLEAGVAPYVSRCEELQAALATRFEALSALLSREAHGGDKKARDGDKKARDGDKKARGDKQTRDEKQHLLDDRRARGVSRGEEVDKAAAAPPTALLKRGLGNSFTPRPTPFDIIEGAAVPSSKFDGIYLGLRSRNDSSRATLLTPHNIGMASFKTSGRMYAWVVFDGPEACFAVRTAPRGGRVVVLDPALITDWLAAHLHGDPPHKVNLDAYLAHIRGLGVEVVEGGARAHSEVRFNYRDTVSPEVERRELAALRALRAEDFAALDWSAYDSTAGAAACADAHETSGNVVIDLTTKTVSVPKSRRGLTWSTNIDYRSLVTYHTHPATRFRGHAAEVPSTADVLITLQGCALDMQAWAFISAPEGTYILRPSLALAEAYLRAPADVAEMVEMSYLALLDKSAAATAVMAADAVEALREVGFVAHFRAVPCIPLQAEPDLFPSWNSISREETAAAYSRAARLAPAELLGADWSAVAAAGESRVIRQRTWMSADIEEGRARPLGNSHFFGSPLDPASYPGYVPGPILAVYFPEDEDMPSVVPHAALRAAQRAEGIWAWIAFVTPRRVTLIAAESRGVQIHGPAVWAASS